jgi:hypothetical protein
MSKTLAGLFILLADAVVYGEVEDFDRTANLARPKPWALVLEMRTGNICSIC